MLKYCRLVIFGSATVLGHVTTGYSVQTRDQCSVFFFMDGKLAWQRGREARDRKVCVSTSDIF